MNKIIAAALLGALSLTACEFRSALDEPAPTPTFEQRETQGDVFVRVAREISDTGLPDADDGAVMGVGRQMCLLFDQTQPQTGTDVAATLLSGSPSGEEMQELLSVATAASWVLCPSWSDLFDRPVELGDWEFQP